MTRNTTIKLTIQIEESTPSSAPFPAARRVIETTGVCVEELSRPSLRKTQSATVTPLPLRRVASCR